MGLGDSKTPLYFVGLACVINIVLDFILVGYCGMRAAGAAIATISSQGISFATALWFLYQKGFRFEFSRHDIRFGSYSFEKDRDLGGSHLLLQDALINVSFLLITVIVNQMGVIASASLGVVEKIIVFAMLPPDGHILGGSHDDGTELRGEINLSYESLSLFGYRDGIGLRAIGLHLLAIPAGNLDGNIHERSGGCCRGGGIFAWL